MTTDQLLNPSDPSPIGRREAIRSRTEGSVTKHWPRVLIEDNRIRTGVYYVHSGALVMQASAQAAGAGWLWIVNYIGATNEVSVRRIKYSGQHGSALANLHLLEIR